MAAVAAGAGLAVPGTVLAQKVDKGPPLELDLVKEFVIAGHGNPERTKELLAQRPGLLNAAWDWGSGDWETAIGGAGHMGRKDIATFLLAQGARMDIFVAAMMGRLDILRPTLAAFPALASSKGPHGITLMQHAQKGGEEAAGVVSFVESLAAG
ncbi:MAG: hypothetical protein ACRD2Y_00770 [Terriglobales bacterium]